MWPDWTAVWDWDPAAFLEARQSGLERFLLVLAVAVLANYVWGKARNRRLFGLFLERVFPVLADRFPLVGEQFQKTASLPADPDALLAHPCASASDTSVTLWLVGHPKVEFCTAGFFVCRRQNLASRLIYSLFVRDTDQVLLEAVVRRRGLPSGCVFVVPAARASWTAQKLDDARMLCKPTTFASLEGTGLAVLSETDQLAALVVTGPGAALWASRPDLIECLEVTDCLSNALHRGCHLKLRLNVGRATDADWEAVAGKARQFCVLAAALADYVPSREVLDDLRQNRVKFQEACAAAQWNTPARLQRRRELLALDR